MKQITNADTILQALSRGAFLTAGKKPNTMVIGWGSLGYYFGEPIFIAPVRLSRFTREKIDEQQCFCVSIPNENMTEALRICGSKSGREVDKYALANMTTKKCRSIDTHCIDGCTYQIECKVIAEMEMDADSLIVEKDDKWYGDEKDYHIMYYGQILELYQCK